MERFLIFQKKSFKIADGTFAGPGCYYNGCCLCSNVENKTSGEKKTPRFSDVCFEESDPFKVHINPKYLAIICSTTEPVRGMGLVLVLRHKLLCMHVYKGLLRCPPRSNV